MLNIEYEHALDFEHLESMDEARRKLSELTSLLNHIIIARQNAKKDILSECAAFAGEKFHKMSWENKLVRLSELLSSSELANEWQEADTAYRQVKNKQDQVFEDLMALKKMADITPR